MTRDLTAFRSRPAKIALIALSAALALGINLVWAPQIGPGVATLAVAPVTLAAWFFGLRAGVLAAAIISAIMLAQLEVALPDDLVTRETVLSRVLRVGALLAVGAVIGRLRDLGEEVKRAHAERLHILERLHAEEAARARLEGVQLAAREMAHRLNNALALTVGNLDLLLEAETLPNDLRPRVEMALSGLERAIHDIESAQKVIRVEVVSTPVGPALDLEWSGQPLVAS